MDLPFTKKKPAKPAEPPKNASERAGRVDPPTPAPADPFKAMLEEMDAHTHELEGRLEALGGVELEKAVMELAAKYGYDFLMHTVGRCWRRADGAGARAVGPSLGIVRGYLGR